MNSEKEFQILLKKVLTFITKLGMSLKSTKLLKNACYSRVMNSSGCSFNVCWFQRHSGSNLQIYQCKNLGKNKV